MKAELTRDGCLRITPQSDLEAYALKAWQEAGKRKTRGPLEVLTEPEAYPFHSTPLPGIATSLPWPEGTVLSTPSTTSDGLCP
jgi:hypothetical protein